MGELESLMDQVENSSKSQQASVSVQLHEMQGENSVLKVENERLKVKGIFVIWESSCNLRCFIILIRSISFSLFNHCIYVSKSKVIKIIQQNDLYAEIVYISKDFWLDITTKEYFLHEAIGMLQM